MKRITKLVVLLVLAAILCPVLAGCCSGSDKKVPQIVYGKKYERLGAAESQIYSYFVFEEGNVGYYYYVHTTSTTDFIWEVAEDGLVYLFPTKVTGDDGTVSEAYHDAAPLSGSFTFGDGFMIWTGGSGLARYVLEGSDLAKSLERD